MSDNKRVDLDKSDGDGDARPADATDTDTSSTDTSSTDTSSTDTSSTGATSAGTAKVNPAAGDSEPVRSPSPAPTPRVRPGASPAALVATVVGTLVVVALVAATVTFGLLWNSKSNELSDLQQQQELRAAVEKVAGDYAVGAATIDYKDPTKWAQALTKGVSDELEKKMNAAQEALTQIMTPLQWQSSAELMDAVVQSESDPMYTVNAYVRVNTRTVQAPDGRSSIVAYELTLKHDGDDWEITDVGGNALGTSGSPAASAQPAAPAAPAQPAAPAAPAPGPGN